MGVHREHDIEAVGFVELLTAPAAKRRWSDEAKDRIVAETLVAGVSVNEVARRHTLKANHLVRVAHAGPQGRAGHACDCGGGVRRACGFAAAGRGVFLPVLTGLVRRTNASIFSFIVGPAG